jgi:hypothetical protein
MNFKSVASTVSIGLHRERSRALALSDFLAKAARIVVKQRMAAARAEIERGRERLWLKNTDDQT